MTQEGVADVALSVDNARAFALSLLCAPAFQFVGFLRWLFFLGGQQGLDF